MARIKGWKKNTKNSWRSERGSMIISYNKNRDLRSGKRVYNVIIGQDMQSIKTLKTLPNKEKAIEYIMKYMRSHPNG